MINRKIKITQLTELTSASLSTTLVGVDNGVTYRMELDTVADAITSRVNTSDRSRISALEEQSGSYLTSFQEDLNGTFAITGSNTFIDDQTISGSIDVSGTIKSQVYLNPKSLDGFTVPDGYNAMLVGPVDINGSVTLEGDSSLLILDKITLPNDVVSGSSQLTSSFDIRYALSASYVSSPNVVLIQTITSASYYELTPVSGTLYIIIG